jgi:general secretion pathway protein M
LNETASGFLSRLGAVALLLGVIGASGALIAVPLANHIGGLRGELASQRELLGRFQAFAASRTEVEAMAERSRTAIRSGLFLTGQTDALRTASLQALVTGIAGEHGIRMSSARTLPSREIDGLRLIGVQAELNADLESFQAMILSLESHRPYLFIESLNVAPTASRRPGDDALRVRLGIFGAIAAGEDTGS